MKNTPYVKILLLVIGSMLSHYACQSQMSEEVKKPEAGFNGGFEEVSQGLPVNWVLYTPKTVKEGLFTIVTDTMEFAEGKQSLKFDVQQCSATGGRFSPGLSKEWEVTPGATYQIRFKIKNKEARIQTRIHGVSSKKSGEVLVNEQTDTGGQWRTFSYSYTVPPDFKRLRFELNILSAGVVNIDDVQVELMP